MDNIQLCYIDNEINKIDKMKDEILSRVGMVPPHKWDEFDKELNKTFGTNPVIDFIKK